MERVQRWREPAVVVVVLVLLVRLVLVAAFAVSTLRLGVNAAPDAAYLASRQLADPTPYVVLAALVLACHLRPPTAHARTLAAVALGVAGVGLLLVLALAVYGYTTYAAPFSQLDLADRLAAAVVPLLAVTLLGLLATRPRPVGAALAGPGEAAGSDDDAAAEDQPAPPDPALEPTWSPDVASGAAWTTAGDAASGRPATGWGTPAGTGWEVPRALDAAGSDESRADQDDRPPEPEGGHPWGRPAR
ncbi:MAG: hypothetical protein AVDCRST_MAG61-3436 [uncultured Friedmanniella sp.]|uniref:Uncharacterized protein n=1 Tax=uncultured Friedmanniella sp. TaxID=335381 RepID=A0A6J4LTR4_9ACTN|nr:hypothetical protein [uncultured Friedmanniella sp.]CAA9340591.1 MAG: hypothetical protein AVDCRST_MAG61-3436 [uncultured Friedmanniella sp.]